MKDELKHIGGTIIDNPVHSVIGGVLGTVFIPIPIAGTAIGAYLMASWHAHHKGK